MANEVRLIDANALMDDVEMDGALYACLGAVDDVRFLVESQPTVDAVEVVHGHWEDGWGEDCYGNIAYKSIDCSECHEIFKIESRDREYWKNRFKVCPFCGAKMDGDGQ